MTRSVIAAVLMLSTPAWAAELTLPSGFTSRVYVTGQGFDRGGEGGAAGVPVMLSLGVDEGGVLYLARSGNRYGSSQSEDVLTRLYRVPPGGVRLSPASEPTYAWGPPLRNPDLGAVLAPGVMFVSTFDPDRQLGVVYRMVEGRPRLFAGGTPARGEPPVLVQPEGVAQDKAGHVYVADRARNVVVKLDAAGKVLDPQFLKLSRARTLAVDATGYLWAGGTGRRPSRGRRGWGRSGASARTVRRRWSSKGRTPPASRPARAAPSSSPSATPAR